MKAAVLIDGENVVMCLKNALGGKVQLDRDIDWRKFFEYLKSLGYEVTIARIYANPFIFLKNPHIANNLEKMGIKVVLAESTMKENGPKSTTDATMIVDGMSILYERPAIDALIIVSGDRDFLPLAEKARELGRTVLFVAFPDSTANVIKNRYQVINLLEFSGLNETFNRKMISKETNFTTIHTFS
ncbi:NYN domain-containing protein [Pyrococcus furiosus DSM 3638]|uniref:NYN domain-containing protein n=3 Tax=Pyrococcus furiosus TaxID=2261 RepID=Q8U1A7_PYRFU|nr:MULTISPECIES: NYN domain-containing protein [Pyrococcus]AAL81438.1 hypothetical protein PF1314 [Pyrococcus furiosus DSM 3638]AFN04097.1 hypothetical protein PFC_05780 [Pyrococcus furiosus COM1]MDK2870200.1 hypothetical protein [Pyrococcus sp.]QEK78953.1 NYN domain-containing protein [Pyrococcus furiosus DSM 3638]